MDWRHYWIAGPMILALGVLGCHFDPSGTLGPCPGNQTRVDGVCECPDDGSEFDPEQNTCVVPDEVGDPNTYVCSCRCDLEDDGAYDVVCDGDGCLFDTCMPADLNPNVSPNLGIPPTADELADHCDLVVEKNIEAFYQTCGQLPDTDCACVPVEAADYFDVSCNDDCVEDPLVPADCSNFDPIAGFKTATNFPGEDPVCLAASSDPPDPTADALAGGFFGQHTLCNITGTAEVEIGEHSDTAALSGRVEFTGKPCPGGGCDVGVLYRIPDIGDFKFEGGFLAAVDLGDEVFIKNSVVSGSTVPAAVPIDASSNGTIPAESTHTSGRGTRKTQLRLRPDPPNVTQAYRGTNSGTVGVMVDWTNHECAILGLDQRQHCHRVAGPPYVGDALLHADDQMRDVLAFLLAAAVSVVGQLDQQGVQAHAPQADRERPTDRHPPPRFVHDNDRRRPDRFEILIPRDVPLHRNPIVDRVARVDRRRETHQQIAGVIVGGLDFDLELSRLPEMTRQALPRVGRGVVDLLERIAGRQRLAHMLGNLLRGGGRRQGSGRQQINEGGEKRQRMMCDAVHSTLPLRNTDFERL